MIGLKSKQNLLEIFGNGFIALKTIKNDKKKLKTMNSMTDDGMYFFTEWIFIVVAFLTQETTEISFKSHFTYAPLFV